ncbi:MAG: TRAP transporter substrate-binding protein [Lachnospiraceae bacterium]|nr:TRAP transporter substrate-binding protein [Lachnospiraceae bacterium]
MKKVISLALVSAMAVSMVACAGKAQNVETTAAATTAAATTAAPAATEAPKAEETKAEESKAEETTAAAAEEKTPEAENQEIMDFILAPSDNPDKVLIKYTDQAADLFGQSYLRGNREFLRILKEELGDKIQIEYYPNGTLGNSVEALVGGLQTDTFQMMDYAIGSYASYTNAFQPLDIPYLVTSSDDAFEQLNGKAGEIMGAKLTADTGIMPIFYNIIGMRQMTNSKRPIKTPEDLKGLKLRTQSNSIQMDGLAAFGCSIQSIPFTELFTALQQGVVDGQENPIETIYAYQFADVQKYLSLTNHLCGANAVVCSQAWYDKQSDEVKAAIAKAAEGAIAYSKTEFDASQDETLEELKKIIEVNELSAEDLAAFQEVAKTAWPKLAEDIGADYVNEVLAALGLSM